MVVLILKKHVVQNGVRVVVRIIVTNIIELRKRYNESIGEPPYICLGKARLTSQKRKFFLYLLKERKEFMDREVWKDIPRKENLM